MKTLVVYYSRKANMKKSSEMIADALKGDREEIVTLKSLTEKTGQFISKLL